MKNILKASNISRKFGQRMVVNNVSIEVKSGEIIGLLGPNGAGKTTTFYMFVGLLKPLTGKILLNGKNITPLPLYKRARFGIGYLPQNSSTFRKLTVEDNLIAIMQVWGTPKNKRQQLLENLLNQFGLMHVRKTLGASLSGGERRRLEIARTLIINPKFLLLDEPFAGIDPVTVHEIKILIKNLVETQNIGVLITDHNVHETLSLCDRSYILANGTVLAEGSSEDIAANESVRQIYLGEKFSLQ